MIHPKSIAGQRTGATAGGVAGLSLSISGDPAVKEKTSYSVGPRGAFYASTVDGRAKRAWAAFNKWAAEAGEREGATTPLLRS